MKSLRIFDALVQIKNWEFPPTGTEVRSVKVLGELLSQELGLN